MFPTSGDSHCSSHQEVKAFKKTVGFVCLLFHNLKESRRTDPTKSVPVPGPVGQKELLENFGVFPKLASVPAATCLGWGEGLGGCLVAEGSASPSLWSRTLLKPHTKKQRATAGLVASLGGGHPSGQGARRPAVAGLGPRALGAPQCGPGQAGTRDSPGTHRGAGEAACSWGCSSPRGGETRGGRTVAKGVPSSWTLPVGCTWGSHSARCQQKGGAPPQDRHTSTFFSTTWP